VFEVNAAALSIASELGHRLTEQGGAALMIDYGHDQSGFSDTLQAVKGHAYHPVLLDPGYADITAHVDFAALGDALRTSGAAVYPVTAQGPLLAALGLGPRSEMLMQRATDAQRTALQQAVQRLAAPEGMGRLFRTLCATQPGLPTPAGFEAMQGDDAP
jgi:NADH dehydrogenase [ubiquinone] 1 alpha subcomplex assembly factor 7